MNSAELKQRLKDRLLEIPINNSGLRELYRLSRNLDVTSKEIEPLLNELCDKNILIRKQEYACPVCQDKLILTQEMIEQLITESGEDSFMCEECNDDIHIESNKTGYIFYDIEDRDALMEW